MNRRRWRRTRIVETPDGPKRIEDCSEEELLLAAYAVAVTCSMQLRERLGELEAAGDDDTADWLRAQTKPFRDVLAMLIRGLQERPRA